VTKSALIPIERPEKGVNESQSKFLCRTDLCPKFKPQSQNPAKSDEHANQHHRNDPLKVINAADKECDQLDIRLARYNQNSE
jgi:hypothetical protein